jgi:hypothetical protein
MCWVVPGLGQWACEHTVGGRGPCAVPQSQHSDSGAAAGDTQVWNSQSDEKPRLAKDSGSVA